MIHKVKNYKKGYDIRITDKNGNSFYIVFGGNLDLYWVSESEINNFVINKQDFFTYDIFCQLFRKLEKEDKTGTLIKNNTFNWVSEASGEMHTQNTMQIIKKQDEFEVVFNHNPECFAPKNYTSVCFCNSGSNHPKIVESFMKVYITLVNYDRIEEYKEN